MSWVCQIEVVKQNYNPLPVLLIQWAVSSTFISSFGLQTTGVMSMDANANAQPTQATKRPPPPTLRKLAHISLPRLVQTRNVKFQDLAFCPGGLTGAGPDFLPLTHFLGPRNAKWSLSEMHNSFSVSHPTPHSNSDKKNSAGLVKRSTRKGILS